MDWPAVILAGKVGHADYSCIVSKAAHLPVAVINLPIFPVSVIHLPPVWLMAIIVLALPLISCLGFARMCLRKAALLSCCVVIPNFNPNPRTAFWIMFFVATRQFLNSSASILMPGQPLCFPAICRPAVAHAI